MDRTAPELIAKLERALAVMISPQGGNSSILMSPVRFKLPPGATFDLTFLEIIRNDKGYKFNSGGVSPYRQEPITIRDVSDRMFFPIGYVTLTKDSQVIEV